MKNINKNIKVYQHQIRPDWSISYSIGIPNESFKVTGTNIGMIPTSKFELCTCSVTIKIDNNNIFLSKDNLLLLSYHDIIIDLKKNIMYKCDNTTEKIMNNLSDRKFINVKNK
jgi:hypothetical protein